MALPVEKRSGDVISSETLARLIVGDGIVWTYFWRDEGRETAPLKKTHHGHRVSMLIPVRSR